MKRSPKISKVILALLVFGVIFPIVARAADERAPGIIDPKSIITLPWDNAAKKPMPPSFVLPAQSRWGCLACHSNTNLSRMDNGREESLFIDPKIIGGSMHKKIACVDCHTNFTYEEHPAANPEDFRKVAGLACMKCHPFQKYLYENSIHGELALSGKKGNLAGKEADPALCSSCHGSHDIQSPRFEPYKTKFRLGAKDVCGKCHKDRYDSFSDYYHGQAHKNGAKDAPVCWDCHSNHRIIKMKEGDTESPVSGPAKLRTTCGKCHDNPGESFVAYAPLIHNRQTALNNNPIYRLLSIIIPDRRPPASEPQDREPEPIVEEVILKETENEGFFSKLIGIFFPRSLRPLGG